MCARVTSSEGVSSLLGFLQGYRALRMDVSKKNRKEKKEPDRGSSLHTPPTRKFSRFPLSRSDAGESPRIIPIYIFMAPLPLPLRRRRIEISSKYVYPRADARAGALRPIAYPRLNASSRLFLFLRYVYVRSPDARLKTRSSYSSEIALHK